ncbi:MAG: glycosyltransferase [Chloroflexi bacterium]|nr:glycosyltransferase [Chloroflexota bacterium]
MKVLVTYPGHLKTVPMGSYACRALESLGHDISCFNLSPNLSDKIFSFLLFKKKSKHYFLNSRFIRVVKGQMPSAVVHIFGFDLERRASQFLRKNSIKSVCWWINDPFQYRRSLDRADLYDAIFTNAKGCVDKYKSEGIVNVFWLPTAADPQSHYPVDSDSRYDCDICFVGDWSQEREKWCAYLAEKYAVLVVGPWGKKVNKKTLQFRLIDKFFDASLMRAVYSSARIVFNLHTWRNTSNTGTNPRLFEAAACGVVQLVDNKDEIPDLFEIGQELLVFDEKNDLYSQIDTVLANPEVESRMRKSSREAALSRHTYHHRMQAMVAALGQIVVEEK